MAITWRNINTPNFSASNQLLVQSGNQVSQGLDQLRGVASEIAQEQRQQATGDILANVGRLDQEGLRTFDTGLLGDNVDRTAVADALTQRRDTLTKTNQQQQALDRQDALAASNIELNRARIAEMQQEQPQDALAKLTLSARLKQAQKDQKSLEALESVRVQGVDFDSPDAVRRQAYVEASKRGLSGEDANKLALNAVTQWQGTIQTSPEQQKYIETLKAQDTAKIDNWLASATTQVNDQAIRSGFNPAVLNLANDDSVSLKDVQAEFMRDNDLFFDGGNEGSKSILSDDGLTAFTKAFGEAFEGRQPTGAEAKYILSQAIANNSLTDGGGLDVSRIKELVAGYKDKIYGENNVGRQYVDALKDLNNKAIKARNAIPKGEEELKKFARELNRDRTKGVNNGITLQNSIYQLADLDSILTLSN